MNDGVNAAFLTCAGIFLLCIMFLAGTAVVENYVLDGQVIIENKVYKCSVADISIIKGEQK